MPTVTTRPTIKVRVPVKFPAQITVQSPLVLTKSGATYEFSLSTGGEVTVFQLRRALSQAGHFFTVDSHANFAVDPGGLIYEAWTSGGVRTSYGDDLSDAIVAAIGTSATQAAYTSATNVTL